MSKKKQHTKPKSHKPIKRKFIFGDVVRKSRRRGV